MSQIEKSFENIADAIRAAGQMLDSENRCLRDEISYLQQ